MPKKKYVRNEKAMRETSKRIKRLRILYGLRSGNMAKEMSISAATYSNYETGLSKPNIENALKLATFFNVTLDYLYKGDISGVPQETARRIMSFDALLAPGQDAEDERLA